jgi:hypothetical protein
VASIAEDWLEAREAGSEDKFWEEADKFRDVRPRRRTTRTSGPTDEHLRQAGTSPREDGPESGYQIVVPLDEGFVIVSLPRKIDRAEAVLVIEAILADGVHD